MRSEKIGNRVKLFSETKDDCVVLRALQELKEPLNTIDPNIDELTLIVVSVGMALSVNPSYVELYAEVIYDLNRALFDNYTEGQIKKSIKKAGVKDIDKFIVVGRKFAEFES